MLGDRYRKPLALLLLAGGVAVLAHALWVSWNDIHVYGGVDLRDKVVFARLMRAGTDPYFARMTADWPEELIDPNYYAGAVRISITPPAICVYMLLCNLPYSMQRIIWFFIEWGALLAACALLALTLRPRRGRVHFLILALYLFAGGYFWRLHVERGQYYSVLLLLLAVSVWLSAKKRSEKLAGVPLGLAIAIRPTLAAAPFILWLLKRRPAALAAVGSAVFVVTACLPITGVQSWANYSKAVKLWELGFVDPKSLPPREISPLPMNVEGIDFSGYLPSRTTNTSIMDRLVKYQELEPWFDYRPYAGDFCRAAALLLVVVVAWRVRYGAKSVRHPLHLIGLGVLLAYDLDYLLAPMRAGYVDILLLFPLALMLPLMLRARFGHWCLLVALAGLLLGHVLNDDLGTYYRSFFVMLSLNALALFVLLRCQPRKAS